MTFISYGVVLFHIPLWGFLKIERMRFRVKYCGAA